MAEKGKLTIKRIAKIFSSLLWKQRVML
jgi:hypothetical protein